MNCRTTTIDARSIRVTRALACGGRFFRIGMQAGLSVARHQRPGERAGASS